MDARLDVWRQQRSKEREDNYVRQRSLFEQKLLSQAEWDQATNAHESARAAVQTE